MKLRTHREPRVEQIRKLEKEIQMSHPTKWCLPTEIKNKDGDRMMATVKLALLTSGTGDTRKKRKIIKI